jgi:2-dehydropantoate 2-reductase
MGLSPKIAIVGSGAIGSYYGAHLAKQGYDVHFLMRSDLEAVQKNGLFVRKGAEEFHLPLVKAYGSTQEIGPCDIVFIAIKSTSNHQLVELLNPLVQEKTLLVTLQNGLGNDQFLAEDYGAERILGGLCFVCLNRIAPGVVENYGHGTVSLGEYGRPAEDRTRSIAEMLVLSGIECNVVESLAETRWRKLVWNIPFNGLTIAAGGITVADILADEGLLDLTRKLMMETIRIARELGYPLKDDFIDYQINRTYPMGPYKPSSLIDFQNKRPVEVEAIWGEPYRRGLKAGVPVPQLEMLYFLLKKITDF